MGVVPLIDTMPSMARHAEGSISAHPNTREMYWFNQNA
jgi:hypothetical protein